MLGAEAPGLATAAGLELLMLRKDGTGAPGGTPAVSGLPAPALHAHMSPIHLSGGVWKYCMLVVAADKVSTLS